MQINVRAHHVEVTKPLKEYAKTKMEKLGKYFSNIQEIQIELDIESNSVEDKRQVAMGTVWVPKAILRATDASSDMYASIDLLFAKLEKQLIKHKEKLKKHNAVPVGRDIAEKEMQEKIEENEFE
ncbi:ribosome-associated translation inhibitor RaiA [bacterium]|jgi:putative sigma-54 modulation protein|nr:ribosome-associated translation inhibitor RaiA [bacterium]MBT3581186.1 ribosome-associated translation inhibitor RaiA [bacterium]MBT4551903.1 ribosome-associated translation inhibitor RaiA [bacterium]MBT7087454.1 ribosome-associated translation inhibitor RaiA [bacterium]